MKLVSNGNRFIIWIGDICIEGGGGGKVDVKYIFFHRIDQIQIFVFYLQPRSNFTTGCKK
jgi:hypothetical protein